MRVLVWIEIKSMKLCKALSRLFHEYAFECTTGSKSRAAEVFGAFDDDLDFAHGFITTCIYGDYHLCLAIIKDSRIGRFIDSLSKRYGVDGRIIVRQTPKFVISEDELFKFAVMQIKRLKEKYEHLERNYTVIDLLGFFDHSFNTSYPSRLIHWQALGSP
jgi:hypothetical protein